MIVLPLDNNAMLPLINEGAHTKRQVPRLTPTRPSRDRRLDDLRQLQGARTGRRWPATGSTRTSAARRRSRLLTHEVQQTGRDRIHGGIGAMQKVAPGASRSEHEGVLAAECLTVTQSLLQAHPDLNVVLCIADDGALGVEKAFMQTHPSTARQRGDDIGGWDGSIPAWRSSSRASTIRSTGALDLVGIGAASVQGDGERDRGEGTDADQLPYTLVSQEPAGKKTGSRLLEKYGA